VTDICLKGCTIRIDNGEDDAYRLAANDVVSIEDGTVYYDGPDASAGSRTPQVPGKSRGGRG
jgi:hypothetical protein